MADLPIRDDLRGSVPYGAPQIEVPVRLNTNENPFPPSPEFAHAIGEAVAAAALTLNRYPDREALLLREALADYLARESGVPVTPTQVWPANGSNEVMEHIFAAFGGPGRTALSFAPTYSMYEQYARDTFTDYATVPRADDFTLSADTVREAIQQHRPSIIIITSPNNPTGTAVPLNVIEAACAASPGMVIVDEAYAEFRRPGTPSALTLLDRHRRLIVTRTMSKAFALAGARVGYAVGDPAAVDALRIVRLPYHLSAITQVVALTALEHTQELLSQVDRLRLERDAMVVWLRDVGLQALDSDANFVMFGAFRDRHAVWQSVLDQGVLVREIGPPGWLRVTVGTPAENETFREALGAALAAGGMIVAAGGESS